MPHFGRRMLHLSVANTYTYTTVSRLRMLPFFVVITSTHAPVSIRVRMPPPFWSQKKGDVGGRISNLLNGNRGLNVVGACRRIVYVRIRQLTPYVSIRQHTPYVSIRQLTPYVSIRQQTAYAIPVGIRQQTAYVSIRQHTSADSIRHTCGRIVDGLELVIRVSVLLHRPVPAIRQHTSAYAIRQNRVSVLLHRPVPASQ